VHAETTSEKIALGRHLDGRVSAVVGTHTHVQTADEQSFPGGTAFLCDAGMCGAADSILGRTKESILRRFLTGMPTTLPVATGLVQICGVVVEVDETTGRATAIRRIREDVQP
ncbi:MAG: YmdB family metallophosphoesterase, partial [Chthoniobacterales bacterium]